MYGDVYVYEYVYGAYSYTYTYTYSMAAKQSARGMPAWAARAARRELRWRGLFPRSAA